VIFPDVNLLLYAYHPTVPQHSAARRWLGDLMNGEEEVALTYVSVFGFLRLTTNRRIVTAPFAPEEALTVVEGWLARPHVRFVVPGPRHLEIAFNLLRQAGTAGNLTTDAQLAALAIEFQGEVHSNDSDFSRFPGLRWKNPLS
jgi:hypothetical protein